ncbi:hypothetical protein ACFC8N_47480 [Streptomyces sp. NPDC055966]|uniref:hypothetical protein n=1 Tax=Streptomyces sp. NPDC055966 TaxID=3345669 RepID=UPI0035D8EAA5
MISATSQAQHAFTLPFTDPDAAAVDIDLADHQSSLTCVTKSRDDVPYLTSNSPEKLDT